MSLWLLNFTVRKCALLPRRVKVGRDPFYLYVTSKLALHHTRPHPDGSLARGPDGWISSFLTSLGRARLGLRLGLGLGIELGLERHLE